jgi:F-type H+-transporting ATPase subunit gamma
MAQTREIRSKIDSVQSTQKITRAMELVAASKMLKAQERMRLSKPYAQKMREVISHVAQATSEYPHPYLQERDEIKRVGYIIVSSDRGLCGGLNINCFKKSLESMRAWQEKGVAIDLCLVGHKAELFFKRFGGDIVATTSHLGDAPKIDQLIGLVQSMLKRYDNGTIDSLFIASNEFINTMTQNPVVQQLLPLPHDATNEGEKKHWDYIYEPDEANVLLDALLKRYIESQVYQAVVENIACFMSAQMIAMKSATDNAGEIIEELQLVYNKARQANITQEIAEIVAGAEAIS